MDHQPTTISFGKKIESADYADYTEQRMRVRTENRTYTFPSPYSCSCFLIFLSA